MNFKDIPPVMRLRAQWARKEILEHPDKVAIDEDELLAWIYHEEDKLWYSIDGNYSSSSPREKMQNRRVRELRDAEWAKKSIERAAEMEAEQLYYSKVREKILTRDNWMCQGCEQKIGKLEIHHIVKRSEGRVDADDNLVTLCKSCHSKADGKEYGLYKNGE